MRNQLHIWSPRPQAIVEEIIAPSVHLCGLPVMSITSIPFDYNVNQHNEALIFTSRHAVDSFCATIDLTHDKTKTIVSIGKKTAEHLSKFGLSTTVIAPSPHTSESLLSDYAFKQLTCNTFTIVAGVKGRALLLKSLINQGKAVSKIECYRRDKINLSVKDMVKFNDKYKIDGIILSSHELTDLVFDLITQSNLLRYLEMPVFVLSERIADHAQQLGFKSIHIAEKANRIFLNKCIINWWNGELL